MEVLRKGELLTIRSLIEDLKWLITALATPKPIQNPRINQHQK
jgi:hypothetical protein